MTENIYHIPALLQQTITALDIQPAGRYADATFGGGGHSRAILQKLGEKGRLYGMDRDIDAAANLPDDPRFTFVRGDFRYIENFMRYNHATPLQGIVADLGVSFHHFDRADRGFSFRQEGPLDMRMNRSATHTAADIIAEISAADLNTLLRKYTDLRNTNRIAEAIIQARLTTPIDTTTRLAEVIEPTLNPRRLKKEMAQVFQALRIHTNSEIEALERLLLTAPHILAPGGRLVILTYHSIEDRIVKNYFRTDTLNGQEQKDFYGRSLTPWQVVTRSPILPEQQEIESNPRARSAKLRAAIYTPHNNDNKTT